MIRDLGPYIEHTLLQPDAREESVRTLCAEAVRHRFAAVCVSSSRVALARAVLGGAPVALAATAGFPHGTASPDAKAFEAERARSEGATDIDFVLHPGAVKDGRWDLVTAEFRLMRRAVPGAVLKVILETGYLDEGEMGRAAAGAVEAGLDFVKTSTGFGPGGATVDVVRLLRGVVGDGCRIKASGGIRTRRDAEALIEAGADRLGTSRGPALVADA